MSALPPPAATLRRLRPATVVALGPTGTALHVVRPGRKPGGVVDTRCGRTTSPAWTAWGRAEQPPPLRLCARCVQSLTVVERDQLRPAVDELVAVHALEVLEAAADFVRLLARVRTDSLVDGSADELVALTVAEPARDVIAEGMARRRNADPLRRADRDAMPAAGTFVAAEHRVRLLELLGRLDPSGHATPGLRVWFADGPPVGSLVDAGGTYDARPWRGRIR